MNQYKDTTQSKTHPGQTWDASTHLLTYTQTHTHTHTQTHTHVHLMLGESTAVTE